MDIYREIDPKELARPDLMPPKKERCPYCGNVIYKTPKKFQDVGVSENRNRTQPGLWIDKTCKKCGSVIYKGYTREVLHESSYTTQEVTEVESYIDPFWLTRNYVYHKEPVTNWYIKHCYFLNTCYFERKTPSGLKRFIYSLSKGEWLSEEDYKLEEMLNEYDRVYETIGMIKGLIEKGKPPEDVLFWSRNFLGAVNEQKYPEVTDVLRQVLRILDDIAKKEARKRFVIRASIITAVVVFVSFVTIKNVLPHEDVYDAQLNTEYTSEIQGAKANHYYKFELTEPGVLFPRTKNLGGWADRCNVMIFKDDGSKDILYYNYFKNAGEGVYLQPGKYVAVLNPNLALDYTIKGYSFSLEFKPKKQAKASKELKPDVAYVDSLSSAEDVKEYMVSEPGQYEVLICAGKPFGVNDGKVSMFKQSSRYTENMENYYKITVSGNSITAPVTSNTNLTIVVREGKTSTITVEAGDNFTKDPYTIYIFKD